MQDRSKTRARPILVAAVVLAATTMLTVAGLGRQTRTQTPAAAETGSATAWRTSRVWHDGKAEWALYDAVRPIYGVARTYEATIFTNTQFMDPDTTTKASDWRAEDAFEVFKHNVSEMIPTEHYTYRFLTTSFVRSGDLQPYKIVFSSQEDCGTTYKQLLVEDEQVRAEAFCYFPDGGATPATYAEPPRLAFHDALSLTLRDYPFDAATRPTLTLDLVADQTDTHETRQRPTSATVRYAGRESLQLPYGTLDAHHLVVEHDQDGGRDTSDYWFAADPDLLRVLVKYEGPYGVRYQLKRLGRWAYWNRSEPRPGS